MLLPLMRFYGTPSKVNYLPAARSTLLRFFQKMIQGKLPISTLAIQKTKTILFKEELPEGWKLFGKTGWSGSDIAKDGKTLEHSWFVGWIEKIIAFTPSHILFAKEK